MIAEDHETTSIKLTNVTKIIRETKALVGINLYLEGGKVYALVGRNGSGKTMLLRILSGLIRPTSGEILFSGRRVTIDEFGAGIGITLENAAFYPSFTGLQNLLLLSSINRYVGISYVRAAMIRIGLDPDDKRTLKKYSLGMKQRLAIAQTIMERPDYVLMDEPTNALDAEGVDRIRKIIAQEAARGAVVVIASHSADDVDLLCDKIYHIEEGRIIAEEDRTEKRGNSG